MKLTFIFAAIAFAFISISAFAFTAENLFLVSDNAADASVAGAVASDVNATIVLTPWGNYSEDVLNKIINASPRKVIIIGGKSAVPENYKDLLEKAGIEVKVVGGKTRQQTSLLMYKAFMHSIKKKLVIADGKEAIAVKDAIPIYMYDNVAEIRELIKEAKENISATNQARIIKENFAALRQNVTKDMVDDVHAEIAKFKEEQNKSGVVLGQKIKAIVAEHHEIIKEAKQAEREQLKENRERVKETRKDLASNIKSKIKEMVPAKKVPAKKEPIAG